MPSYVPSRKARRSRQSACSSKRSLCMKLVTFEAPSPFGTIRRIGAVMGAGEMNQGSQIVDLNTAYGLQLREQGDNRWAPIADAALPPDMLEFLEGGPQARLRAQRRQAAVTAAAPDLDA